MLTANPHRSFVVRWRSVMVNVSCSVVGCMRFVMAFAALAAELSMHRLSSINAVTLIPSTTTFDSAVVWERWSSTMLRLVVLDSSPTMTRHFLSRYSFAVFSSCAVLIVALSSSSRVLPAEGFASLWVLPRIPVFFWWCLLKAPWGVCVLRGFHE